MKSVCVWPMPLRFLVLSVVLLVLFASVAAFGRPQIGEIGTSLSLPPSTVELLDVAYTPPAGGDQALSRLDVWYLPDGRPKRFLVFVHGGSWVGGDKSNLNLAPDFVPWFVQRGYAVVALNFRLASAPGGSQVRVTWADQEADIAAALAWLLNGRSNYGVTATDVVLLGFSSGAHLVALLAADESWLLDVGLSFASIQAAISFDVHTYDVPFALSLMPGSVVEPNIPLITYLFGSTAQLQRIGSPSTFAPSAQVPPTFLVSAEPHQVIGSHGYITWQTAQRYQSVLSSAGRAVTWRHYDAKSHSGLVMGFGTVGDQLTMDTEAFLAGLNTSDLTESVGTKSVELKAAPNPFNAMVEFEYELARDSIVKFDVFDVQGLHVRTLENTILTQGHYTKMWDGRDDGNTTLASGVYIARLVVGGESVITRRVVLVE